MSTSTENTQQPNNFNPSWMKSTFNSSGGVPPIAPSRVLGDSVDEKDFPLADPILVKQRYGREDLLALANSGHKPPRGLEMCEDLFVANYQAPITLTTLTDFEQRLMATTINSSKAISSLSAAEKAQFISAGGVVNGGSSSFQRTPGGTPTQPTGNSGPWIPVKSSWGSRGNLASRGTPVARGGLGIGRGAGAVPGSVVTQASPVAGDDGFASRFATRTRGTQPTGRGGSTAAAAFNTRAQGLYDPKDPKDRPRPRLRSTSEEEVASSTTPANGNAWQQQRTSNNGWALRHRDSEASEALPEWMNDSDDDIATLPPQAFSRDLNAFNSTAGMMNLPIDETNRTSVDVERPPWVRQLSAPAMQASPPAAPREVTPPQPPEVYQNQKQFVTTSNYGLESQFRAPYMLPSSIESPVASAPGLPQPAAPLEFYYLDPQKTLRGPFEKAQMDTWFVTGYFDKDLLVRRSFDDDYVALADLMARNGPTTPFDYKPEQPRQPTPPKSVGPMMGASGQYLSGWPASMPPSDVHYPYAAAMPYDHSILLQQRIEAESQRRMQDEMMKRMREEIAEREAEKLHQLHLREEQLKLVQEQMAEKEQKLQKTAQDMEAQLELERQRLAEKAREVELEKERVAALEEAKRQEELKRKAEERQRQEAAEKQKREEFERQEKLKQEEAKKRRAEEAAEIEKLRLEAAARESREKLLKKEEERSRREEAAQRALEEQYTVTEEWEVAGKPKKEEKKARPAPWTQPSASREKTMAQIMAEEERANLELRQLEAKRREEARQLQLQAASSWSSAASRLSASTPKATTPRSGNGQSAWGNVAATQVTRVNPMLDGPPLVSSKKPAAAAPVATSVKKPAPQKPAAPAKAKPAAETMQQWALARMRQLNSTIDLDVLYDFIIGTEDPQDIEDYIVSYFGDNKQAKDFAKEFIKRRSDERAGRKTDTTASVSLNTSSEWATAAQSGKKKKGKGRLVVDSSCLGFTPAADPNRTNKGEIETVPLASGQRR